MTTPVLVEPAGSPHARRWSRRRVVVGSLVAVLVAAVVVAASIVAWHWRHPALFYPGSDALVTYGRLDVGRVMYIGMTYPVGHPTRAIAVHVDGVTPRIVENTAGAQVSFFVCTIARNSGVGGIGSGDGATVRHDCSRLVPATDVDMTIRPAFSDQIVMRLLLTKPGTVRVDGMDVSYSAGWQHGTQWTGESARFTAPGD